MIWSRLLYPSNLNRDIWSVHIHIYNRALKLKVVDGKRINNHIFIAASSWSLGFVNTSVDQRFYSASVQMLPNQVYYFQSRDHFIFPILPDISAIAFFKSCSAI